MKKSYSEKLRDPRWQRKRLQILERDEFCCRNCGDKESPLHVHHCFYDRGEPWDTDSELLLTLCETCHDFRQEKENDCKRALGFIFAKISNDELNELTETGVRLASTDDIIPSFRDEFEVDWLSDFRWYQEACRNKGMRKFYEIVVGKKMRWGQPMSGTEEL